MLAQKYWTKFPWSQFILLFSIATEKHVTLNNLRVHQIIPSCPPFLFFLLRQCNFNQRNESFHHSRIKFLLSSCYQKIVSQVYISDIFVLNMVIPQNHSTWSFQYDLLSLDIQTISDPCSHFMPPDNIRKSSEIFCRTSLYLND